MKRIETHCLLQYQPAEVWAVLADFDAYVDWNPLNVWAQGSARTGGRVAMRFIDPGRPGATIRQIVTVTDAQPEQRLEWLGRIPLLFTGRHYFELQPAPGGTRLTHGEQLSGLVPALWSKARTETQRAAYDRMNHALADRLAELAKR